MEPVRMLHFGTSASTSLGLSVQKNKKKKIMMTRYFLQILRPFWRSLKHVNEVTFMAKI